MILCIIRPYSEKDFDDYANTLLETWPCNNVKEARENASIAAKKARENQNVELWVAEVEGKAVGFILLEYTRVWGHRGESFDQEAVCIDWLDVHPGFQERRIAGQLLSKAQERGRARGLRLLFMHTSVKNLAMINFASKNGFKFEKYLKDFWGEGSGNAFLLTKEIAACANREGFEKE